jgi:hypothetical protein
MTDEEYFSYIDSSEEGEKEEDFIEEEKLYGERVYETLDDPNKFLEEYRQWWIKTYGIDPTLKGPALYHREATLRRKGPQGIRKEREEEFKSKLRKKQYLDLPAEERETIMAKKIQQAYRKYRTCENLTPEEIRKMDPRQLIRLRFTIEEKGKKSFKVMCYDALKLYLYLTTNFGSDSFSWKIMIPVGGKQIPKFLTHRQIDQIKKIWSELSPCEKNIPKALQVEYSETNETLISKKLYNEIVQRDTIPDSILVRLFNKNGDYLYQNVVGYHEGAENQIYVPSSVLEALKVNPGNIIYMEECFRLTAQPITYLKLLPLSIGWNKIPDKDIETIVNLIQDTVDKYVILKVGDPIAFDYKDIPILLQVAEIKSKGRSLTVGLSKLPGGNVIDVDFLPFPI